jgi:predicted lipoprotein
MNRKAIKYGIGILVIGLLGYNSIYFQPLDKKLADNNEISFDAKAYVDGIWGNELRMVYKDAPDIALLIDSLEHNTAAAFETYGYALGIGNIGYFRVKGEGMVTAVNNNNVLLQVGSHVIEVETEFVYGNAIRDASGLVKLNDYDNSSDFNSISESINEKIRKELIPEFRSKVKIGDKVRFEGAIELNKAHLKLSRIEVIPITLQITE